MGDWEKKHVVLHNSFLAWQPTWLFKPNNKKREKENVMKHTPLHLEANQGHKQDIVTPVNGVGESIERLFKNLVAESGLCMSFYLLFIFLCDCYLKQPWRYILYCFVSFCPPFMQILTNVNCEISDLLILKWEHSLCCVDILMMFIYLRRVMHAVILVCKFLLIGRRIE